MSLRSGQRARTEGPQGPRGEEVTRVVQDPKASVAGRWFPMGTWREGHGGRDMVPHGDMEGAQATAQEGQAGQNGPDSMLLALKSQSRASARDRHHLT